jgi:hypothetical protein
MRQTILVAATKKQMRQATERSAAVEIQSQARRMLCAGPLFKHRDRGDDVSPLRRHG